jgi:predicted nuclease of predicted toxin-antitoxin system
MSFKVLCDVHIAFRVAKFFEQKGYEAVHVNRVLDGYYTKDAAIADYANQHGFTVLTKDLDFKNSHLLQDKPRKLLYITLGNIPTTRLIQILESNFEEIAKHFAADKCLVELGDGYLKVVK